MPLEPAALPALLAGPILRRVESDLVSVWIATSHPCDVALLLFEGAGIRASETPLDDHRAKWISAEQRTRQVGAHLHVLTVVLDLRVPDGNAVVSGGATLAPNIDYCYDLRITDHTTNTQRTLKSERYLEPPTPLGYDVDTLPGFRSCPQERDRLVIVHGSCRQLFAAPPVQDDPADDDPDFRPPGRSSVGWPGHEPSEDDPVYQAPADLNDKDHIDDFPDDTYPYLAKRDGMLWVDELIAARGPLKIAERPHQLFLTGDQIYADQPPAMLAPVLNNLARVLVGPEDAGANPTGDLFKPVTLENFPPGFRLDIVCRSGGLTTDADESHLISFGEFVAYYLLTWSPELWKQEGFTLWPDDFNPDAIAMPEDWRVRFIFDDDRGIGGTSDHFETVKTSLQKLKKLNKLPDVALPEDASNDEIAQFYFDQRRQWLTDKYLSPALFEWWMRRFHQQLPRVRRALANVPTYMVFDDHDISDDWNFSRQWREQVYTRPLGVDIVRNGLMACTLMQAWGNDARRWSKGPELDLLDRIGEYAPAMATAAANGRTLQRDFLDRIHKLLGLPHTPFEGTPTFRPLVEYSFQVEGPCHRVLAVDGRTKRRFPTRRSQAGGIDYEGPTGLPDTDLPTGLPGEEATGLFGDSPMAAALPPRPAGDSKITIVVTGVPVIGPEGMELALVPIQRLARILGEVDAEAWSYEPTTYEALLAALARYEQVVLLSGDIHIGYSAVLDYWSSPDGGPVRTARIAQLVSSGLTKDWGSLSPPLRNHALSLDVFESATNPELPHAERVGWGTPFRTALTPPPVLDALVTHPERAHPFYRARLKMRAPVVPTHGWPQGTQEVREPNWAWRAMMVRDLRPETTQPPTIERRWTPVELPPNPLDPDMMGWHAKAARREAFGRIFAANPNVGIVTFHPDGLDWSVRHVLAGELQPLPETGAVPHGLQPFIVHQFTLAPRPPESWETDRPKIVDDGGWGLDKTEPLFPLLVDWLPKIWQGASEFTGAVYKDLPPVIDEVTREALITDAASRVSSPFRRRVIRDLGPFAVLSNAELDAVTGQQVAALVGHIGRFDADKEARALIRPDLERLLAFNQSLGDPATIFDDLLLLTCSEWVYDRVPVVSTVAGILATVRSPVTKHVPLLKTLLGGLWDLWRNRTYAEYWTEEAVSPVIAGLLATPPRLVVFIAELVAEILYNIIQDDDPRFEGGPPIFTPEVAVTAAGVALSLNLPKRFTFVSGWEPTKTPHAPGTRATSRTPESIARQTLSLMIHPDKRARYTAPAQKLSASMIPSPPPEIDEPHHGSLLLGYDLGLEQELDIGRGFKARFELDGRAFHQIFFDRRVIQGRLGRGVIRATILRPTRFDLGGALDVRLAPAASLQFGFTGGPEEDSFKPELTFRIALNDREDRVSFRPGDELLLQLLPPDGLALPIDAAWEWNYETGWRFAGFGEISSAVLVDRQAPKRPEGEEEHALEHVPDEPPERRGTIAEVVTPINTRLGVVTFHERRLEVTTAADSSGATFDTAVTATVSLNLGPARIALSGLGVKATLHLASEFENLDELLGISVTPALPTGLAVSIDAGAVSGGGFLQRIEQPSGAVTWRGGVALRLGERYDAAAFGIVQTGGGKRWTLLALFTVRFSPPIHLSLGWKLRAIGGLIALNRTMDVNALRDAATASTGATGTQGNLDALLLPDRPEERFLELVPALERFFPNAPDHKVVGLLAELEWRAETGTKFADFRLALLAELETLQIAMYGTVRLGFPTVDDPHILRLRASIEALLDLPAMMARFSFTITEGFLFERVHLTGGAALLVTWGARPNLVLTLGGFHPSFRPFIPEGLREPPRVGLFWKPHDAVELSIQAYIARTLTSLQFGFAGHLRAGASWGGIRADAEFNFLVMIAPEVRFEVDLSIRVAVFLFGADLISASFRGLLAGPRRWYFEGSVSWEVCGVSVSKDIGPHEWGDPPRVSVQTQEARQLLGDAFDEPGNWTVRRSPRLPIRVRPAKEDALDPRDQIDIRQTLLPLGIDLEVNDANPLADRGAWTLKPATPALAAVSDLTDVFPTRRYLQRPPKETPFRGGLASGVRVGGTGWAFREDAAIVSDEELTEDLVLDSLPVRPKRETGHVRLPFDRALLVSSPTFSLERRWTRHTVLLESA